MKRLLVLGLVGLAACASETANDSAETSSDITDVSPTWVKQQKIGNCWLYATAAWAEAMHNGAPDAKVLDISESYWTYWYFFDQLTRHEFSPAPTTPLTISTGGNWRYASELIARYGWMTEGGFLPNEELFAFSDKQKETLDYLNMLLTPGHELDTPEKRTPEKVIEVLDLAFQVPRETAAQLRATFGERGERNFKDPTVAANGPIHRASDLALRPTPKGKALTLMDAIGTSPTPEPGHSIDEYPREGELAWQVRGTTDETDNASIGWNDGLMREVQKALHSHRPVIIDWWADETHLDDHGAFQAERNPKFEHDDPYGHESMITDYEVDAPGFGILPAGVEEARPDALAAALAPGAVVKFFRIKNSWGSITPIAFAPGAPGYHDLTRDYLDGFANGHRRLVHLVLPHDILHPDG